MNGLGRRQRLMLLNMAEYGNGQWPQKWHLSNSDRSVMRSLYQRGLVTSTGMYATLTREGEKIADLLLASRVPVDHRQQTA